VETGLRETSKLGNGKHCTTVNVILTAEMRGKLLSGRAGEHAAGPAARAEAQQPWGTFSLPRTGTYPLSRLCRLCASVGVRAKSLAVFHLRFSEHSASGQ